MRESTRQVQRREIILPCPIHDFGAGTNVARRNRRPTELRQNAPLRGAQGKGASKRPAPKANPPRPNKLFLAIAVFVLLLWMSFLGVMAYLVRA